MNREAQKILGTQVKEVLSKAVGGIYVGRVFRHALTDFFSKFSVTEDGLEIIANDYMTFKLPIADEEEYINYAVGVENDEEEWEGSVYFDYCFEIAGYKIAFNESDKGEVLTWEQFEELAAKAKCLFSVESIDGGSVYVSVSDASIGISDFGEIVITSDTATVTLDKEIVDAIYNDSVGANEVCYRIEFSNGMADMSIEVDDSNRLSM